MQVIETAFTVAAVILLAVAGRAVFVYFRPTGSAAGAGAAAAAAAAGAARAPV